MWKPPQAKSVIRGVMYISQEPSAFMALLCSGAGWEQPVGSVDSVQIQQRVSELSRLCPWSLTLHLAGGLGSTLFRTPHHMCPP